MASSFHRFESATSPCGMPREPGALGRVPLGLLAVVVVALVGVAVGAWRVVDGARGSAPSAPAQDVWVAPFREAVGRAVAAMHTGEHADAERQLARAYAIQPFPTVTLLVAVNDTLSRAHDRDVDRACAQCAVLEEVTGPVWTGLGVPELARALSARLVRERPWTEAPAPEALPSGDADAARFTVLEDYAALLLKRGREARAQDDWVEAARLLGQIPTSSVHHAEASAILRAIDQRVARRRALELFHQGEGEMALGMLAGLASADGDEIDLLCDRIRSTHEIYRRATALETAGQAAQARSLWELVVRIANDPDNQYVRWAESALSRSPPPVEPGAAIRQRIAALVASDVAVRFHLLRQRWDADRDDRAFAAGARALYQRLGAEVPDHALLLEIATAIVRAGGVVPRLGGDKD